MLKRILCVLLVLISVPFGSLAMEPDFEITEYDCNPIEEIVPLKGVNFEVGEGLPTEESSEIALFSDMTFEDYIVDKVMNAEELPTKITGLGQFNIPVNDFESIYFDITLKNPQLMLRTAHNGYGYNPVTNMVVSVNPLFVVDSIEEVKSCRLIMEEKIKEYTDLAAEYDTPLEMLLEIHDKMVAETDYDVRVLNNETVADVPNGVYHAIGVFRDNLAVCQGYSQAFYAIAKKLNIEIDFCFSEEKNHMWNYVNLDGSWYNLDVTNDDPIENDENGAPIAGRDPRAYHIYFLISDDNLNDTIHGADRKGTCGEEHICNNKKYESGYIFNVATPVSFAREQDGMFHALIDVFGGGVEDQKMDFKSNSLKTGDAIASFYVEDNNFYYSVYPTKNVNNAMFMYRTGNSKKTGSLGQLLTFEKNRISTINFGANIPESITTFLWDAETLAPVAAKTNWSK